MREYYRRVRMIQNRYHRIRTIRFARVEILETHWRRLEMDALADVIAWEQWVLGQIDPEVVAGDLSAIFTGVPTETARSSFMMRRREHHSRTRPLPDKVVQKVLYEYVLKMQKQVVQERLPSKEEAGPETPKGKPSGGKEAAKGPKRRQRLKLLPTKSSGFVIKDDELTVLIAKAHSDFRVGLYDHLLTEDVKAVEMPPAWAHSRETMQESDEEGEEEEEGMEPQNGGEEHKNGDAPAEKSV